MSTPIEMEVKTGSTEIPMRVGGEPGHYITETELYEILANYVTRTELDNEPTIVRWTGGNS